MADPAEVEEVEEEEIEEVEDGLSDVEREQQVHGWTPEADWVAAGKDPKDWRTAEHFAQIGENVRLRNENRDYRTQASSFDQRIKNNESLAKNLLDAAVSDLEGKRDAATADGDVETSKGFQTKIDEAKEGGKEEVGTSDESDPVIIQWNEENPWIENPGAKSTYAGNLYQRAKGQGKTPEEALDYVNVEVEKEYPGTIKGGAPTKVVNARRSEESVSQKGKGKSTSKGTLSMSDLTPEEKRMRETSSMFATFTDEKFLTIVKKSREDNE